MNLASRENLILIIIAILALVFIVKFIKGLIKAVLIIILALTLGVSLYNLFYLQKPLSYEINRYRVDIAYFIKSTSINKQAYQAINEIKEEKDKEGNIKKLENLLKEAEELKHSEESNPIHNKYIANFKTIVLGFKTYNTAQNYKDKINNIMLENNNLKISLVDILLRKEKE